MKFVYSRLLLELNGKSGSDGADEDEVVPCSGIPRDELDRLLVSGRSGANQFFCDLGEICVQRFPDSSPSGVCLRFL